MAQFCEECNKPIANTPESKRLAVYCQCVPLVKAKRIAEREMVRNTVDSRPPITNKEEKTEIEVRENAAIDALGTIAATEEEDKRCAINYELVLDDMMTRYTEMGIAIIAIRRILKEQGKDPDA